MTRSVNIHEAKTHLSRLVDEVAEGGEVIIARAGKKPARLAHFASSRMALRDIQRGLGGDRRVE